MIDFLIFFIHGTIITVHVQIYTDSSDGTKKQHVQVFLDISFLGGVSSPHDIEH